MVSRRGLFRLLSGVALSPVLKPLAGLLPEPVRVYYAPASLAVNNSLPGLLAVYYDSRFVDTLRAQTALETWNRNHERYSRIPEFKGGNTIQFFTYKPEAPHDISS